mmetsp:Transcript_10714/g.29387  ORF Transcript_10714/g.29387 Transcript_10714/m.29387 type:complete len:317 (+) Transcript_10714:416-1366(+)
MPNCIVMLLMQRKRAIVIQTLLFITAVDSIQRAIILTSQQSGSTWLASSLNRHSRVVFADENLIKYHRVQWVAWEEYKKNIEHAFPPLLPGVDVIGFKLMYSQIPGNIVRNFGRWLLDTNITIIHLVREATIMRLASNRQFVEAVRKGTYQGWERPLKEPAMPLLIGVDELSSYIRTSESEILYYKNMLSRYAYGNTFSLTYEDLTSLRGISHANALQTFLGLPIENMFEGGEQFLPPKKGLGSKIRTVRRNNGTCFQRIKEFGSIVGRIAGIANSRTVHVCLGMEIAHRTSATPNADLNERKPSNWHQEAVGIKI